MEKYIKIINIIDKSGSMGSMKNTAISGFNEFINEQKEIEGNALVSTILFSTNHTVLYEDINVKDCYELNNENYITGGMTSLYDAICVNIDKEIDKLGNLPLEERPEKTLCVILTDGEENSSKLYNKEKTKELINEMRNGFKWEFIFLGADENASLTAETIGISKGNAYSFSNDSSGLKDAYNAVSFASTTMRSSSIGNVTMDSLMDDYRENKKGV